MKLFDLDFGATLVRYYIMMGLILGAFAVGQPLLAFLAFPVFISAILGVKFFGNDLNAAAKRQSMPLSRSSNEYMEAA